LSLSLQEPGADSTGLDRSGSCTLNSLTIPMPRCPVVHTAIAVMPAQSNITHCSASAAHAVEYPGECDGRGDTRSESHCSASSGLILVAPPKSEGHIGTGIRRMEPARSRTSSFQRSPHDRIVIPAGQEDEVEPTVPSQRLCGRGNSQLSLKNPARTASSSAVSGAGPTIFSTTRSPAAIDPIQLRRDRQG
jgi:hypothetical protein